MRAAVLIVLMLVATTAQAEPEPEPDRKIAWLAFALPVGVTLGGVALAVVGDDREFEARGGTQTFWQGVAWVGGTAFVVGPSLGRIYIRDPWSVGLAGRVLGVGMIVLGAYIDRDASAPGDGFVLALGGLIPYVAGGLYETISAPILAERHNRRSESERGLSLVPMVGGRTGELGLTLGGRF